MGAAAEMTEWGKEQAPGQTSWRIELDHFPTSRPHQPESWSLCDLKWFLGFFRHHCGYFGAAEPPSPLCSTLPSP